MTIFRFFWPQLCAPLATIRRRVFWLRHATTRRRFSGCPIASPSRQFVADSFGYAIAHPSFNVAIPLANALLRFFALSPSFAYGFKLKRAPLWHNLIQASRRRAIVTYHRADGRHLIKIHPADGRSSIIAPTGNHRYSQRRRASTATTPTGAIYFKNFASPSSAWAIPASCCTLPFASRTKTIRCLSASLHLIVASCAKSPHNHIIGHCRPQPHPSWTFL